MSAPCIITVAITGSVPRKKDTPAVPVTVPELIDDLAAAMLKYDIKPECEIFDLPVTVDA